MKFNSHDMSLLCIYISMKYKCNLELIVWIFIYIHIQYIISESIYSHELFIYLTMFYVC